MALFGSILLVLAGGGILAYGILVFNGLVELRNETRRAWSNVDVLLKQRADEVPNLVATVKGYAAHERALLEGLTDARARAAAARSRDERVGAEHDVGALLTRVLAVAEAYPTLKADQAYLALQKRLSELEDLIADRRELYNDAVTALHNRIETYPDAVVAKITGQTRREPLFEA